MAIDNFVEYEGVVIRSVDYGDSSKIIGLFSREKGVISLIAKGVKRPKNKQQNLIALYTRGLFSLKKGKDMYFILDGEVLDMNLSLRKDIKNIYGLQFLCDLIERNLLKGESNEKVYDLFIRCISLLKNKAGLRILSYFLMKFAGLIGYKPNLLTCSNCGSKKFTRVSFDIARGGILCHNCSLAGYELSKDDHLYLVDLLYKKYEDIGDYELDENKIFMILVNYLQFNSQIKLPKSYDMVCRLYFIN